MNSILVSMPKNLRSIFFNDSIYRQLECMGKVEYNETNDNFTPEEMKKRLAETDIVVTGWGQCKITPDTAGKRLKLVAHTGGSIGPVVDTDIYDMGVRVVSGNELFAKSVAEGVLSYILCELRRLNLYSFKTKSGSWTPNGELKTRSLHGRTIGIVSLGKISRYLICLLKPFDVKIKVYSTHPSKKTAEKYGIEYTTLEDVFSACDIVTVHTAANGSTRGMINERLFAMLKSGSIFINTSRGSVIDETALARQLKTGRFSAVLDVYSAEPIEAKSPFFELENVTLYPHMAGPASDMKNYITGQVVSDIEHFIDNKPLQYEIDRQTARGMTQTG